MDRFFDEAHAAALVDHPGVVKVFDCDVDPASARAFIVMEYLDGPRGLPHLQPVRQTVYGEALHLASAEPSTKLAASSHSARIEVPHPVRRGPPIPATPALI